MQLKSDRDKRAFLLQNAFLLAREHNGCRRLQRRVEEEDDGQFAQELLSGLADQFGVLMVD